MTWLKRILIGLGIVLVLLIALVVVAGYWTPDEKSVTQTMSMTVGSRTVTVGGHYKDMTQESLADGIKVVIDGHVIVVYGEESRPPVPDVNWLLRVGTKPGQRRQPTLTVNNVYAVMRAVQSGLGIGTLPEFMVQGATDLVQVLPELEGPKIDAYFVYPEELRNSKRIQVFRDFLLRKVAEADL